MDQAALTGESLPAGKKVRRSCQVVVTAMRCLAPSRCWVLLELTRVRSATSASPARPASRARPSALSSARAPTRSSVARPRSSAPTTTRPVTCKRSWRRSVCSAWSRSPSGSSVRRASAMARANLCSRDRRPLPGLPLRLPPRHQQHPDPLDRWYSDRDADCPLSHARRRCPAARCVSRCLRR